MGPGEYELEHEDWRPGQEAAVREMLGLEEEAVRVLEAPTGSGKTAIARAVGSQATVTALCRTKVLQEDNYASGYGFDALYGRGNYPCAVNPGLTCGECEYADVGMHECEDSDRCPYLVQKGVVMGSKLRALNYAYFLLARWPRQLPTDYMFYDEAHLLSDIVLDFTGVTITESDRRRWGLAEFPRLSSEGGGILILSDPVPAALGWLEDARNVLLREYRRLDRIKGKTEGQAKRLRQCENMGRKVRATLDALRGSAKDWYIKSGPGARKVMGRPQPAFVCRPLTARHHAPRFFLDGWRSVMMSATIGEPETFAHELGLSQYRMTKIPSAWAPETRPVLVPKDAPKMGRAARGKGEDVVGRQAEIISDLLSRVGGDWSGVIHHTSISGAKELVSALAHYGLADRLWLPTPGLGTEEQMAQWEEQKGRARGALAVTWSWHTGVDLLEEKISIVAKVPFPFLGADYERARLSYDGKFYLQRTAWDLEQACGRTRRGRPQDYDTGEEQRGLVAIVDGNWRRVQKYMSDSFRESLVEI